MSDHDLHSSSPLSRRQGGRLASLAGSSRSSSGSPPRLAAGGRRSPSSGRRPGGRALGPDSICPAAPLVLPLSGDIGLRSVSSLEWPPGGRLRLSVGHQLPFLTPLPPSGDVGGRSALQLEIQRLQFHCCSAYNCFSNNLLGRALPALGCLTSGGHI